MAIVSRLQLNHPALGTTGGAALHASIESLYQKIGDSISSRWFAIADFDNGETVDLKHDFSTDMSNIRYDIYVQVAGEWVVLTNESSPARSAFTVVEKSGAEGSTLQITNVSGGNNLEAAVVLVNDPLYLQQGDIKDVDITGAEDGQALVYQSSSKKFVPGASGDSSFKLQSISTPNAVIKGGYILLQDGRELATHDGSGSLQADFGQDLTINLTTVLGSAPANATTYYLYVDLHSLSASVTTTDTGRVLYAVTQSNFKLLTSKPELVDQARYIPRGLIRSATTGTAWSGAGSYFATLAFLAGKGEAEDNLLLKVFKSGHLLTANDLGTPMYLLGGTYTAARADSSDMAEVVGLVHSIVDSNYFYLAIGGEVPLTTTVTGGESITAGKVFFLSPTTAGRLTETEPTVVGHVSKPIGICVDTGNIAFYNYRGSVVGASNVRTQISLANSATTTVQNVSAYEAGELTGWVSIAATTPLKFYVAAQFSKNGAGNNYNISYQTSGDAPPAGFLVQVTAAGLVQIVMPSVTGFASASINYALNAPAVGVTLPLSVPSSGIAWSEPVAFRNKIINGNFDIWQRGTSFSVTANNTFSADRWTRVFDGSGATRTVSRQNFAINQTEVPGAPKYFINSTQSVAGTGGTFNALSQRIESVRTFAGQTVTISYWAKSSTGSSVGVVLGQRASTNAFNTIASQTLTSTWTKYTGTITLPAIASGVTEDGNDHLEVAFNLPLNATHNVDIAQVQLEAGSVTTPFEHRPIGTELQLCQRYFEKSYNLSTPLQSNTTVGLSMITVRATSGISTEGSMISFKVPKFKTPVVTTYRRDGAAGSQWRYNTATYATITTDLIGENGFSAYFNGTAAGLAINNAVTIDGHWVADAEL